MFNPFDLLKAKPPDPTTDSRIQELKREAAINKAIKERLIREGKLKETEDGYEYDPIDPEEEAAYIDLQMEATDVSNAELRLEAEQAEYDRQLALAESSGLIVNGVAVIDGLPDQRQYDLLSAQHGRLVSAYQTYEKEYGEYESTRRKYERAGYIQGDQFNFMDPRDVGNLASLNQSAERFEQIKTEIESTQISEPSGMFQGAATWYENTIRKPGSDFVSGILPTWENSGLDDRKYLREHNITRFGGMFKNNPFGVSLNGPELPYDFIQGGYEGIREDPVLGIASVAAGFLLPVAGTVGKAAISKIGLPKLVSSIPKIGGPVVKYTEPVTAFGLTALFGYTTGKELLEEPEKAQYNIGKMAFTEFMPMLGGGMAAMRTLPRVGGLYKTIGKQEIPITDIGWESGYPIHGAITSSELEASFRSSTLLVNPIKEAGPGGARAAGAVMEPIPKMAALPGEDLSKVYGWHGTPRLFKNPEVAAGSSELPGLYAAPIYEGYFSKVGPAPSQAGRLFDFRFPTISIPSAVRVEAGGISAVPEYMSQRTTSLMAEGVPGMTAHRQSGLFDYIENAAPKGIFQMPMTKSEYEAVLPVGTKFTDFSINYYTRLNKQRVPIVQAKAFSDGVPLPSQNMMSMDDILIRAGSYGRSSQAAASPFSFISSIMSSAYPTSSKGSARSGSESIYPDSSVVSAVYDSVFSGISSPVFASSPPPSVVSSVPAAEYGVSEVSSIVSSIFGGMSSGIIGGSSIAPPPPITNIVAELLYDEDQKRSGIMPIMNYQFKEWWVKNQYDPWQVRLGGFAPIAPSFDFGVF